MITIRDYTYKSKSKQVRDIIILSVLIILPFVYLVIQDSLHLPSCQFKAITGYPCPGCGLRRSLDMFSSVRLIEAIIQYPPLLPLLVLYIVLVVHNYFKIFHKKYIYINDKLVLISICILLTSIFGNWLIKVLIKYLS